MQRLTDRQQGLLQALESAPIGDPASELTFERRLARESGWSEGFAHRVVAEYRRYLFLAKEAGHPVTPSDEVDQAWHLHMVYTRSYWHDFCGTHTGSILGIDLHHGPTKGGRAEESKFDDWYARTLTSYERFFGERPPRDIWPPASIRFGRAPNFQRVNTRENWVINKRTVRRTAAAALMTGTVAGSVVGCAMLATSSARPTASGGEPIRTALTIAVIAAATVLAAAMIWMVARRISSSSSRSRRTTARDGGSGCGGSGWFWWGGSGCGSSHDNGGDGGSSGCGSSGCGGGGD